MQSGTPQWTVLLNGSSLKAAEEVVYALAEALKSPTKPSEEYRRTSGWEGAALHDGRAGLALFFSYVWKWKHDEEHRLLAVRNLDRAVRAIQYKAMQPCLFHGFLGIIWVLEQLSELVPAYDVSQCKHELYAGLHYVLSQTPKPGIVADHMRGELGIGFYLLENVFDERDERPTKLLSTIIDRLAETSTHTELGTSWVTSPELMGPGGAQEFPNGAFNLGMAHGIPGVIVFLARSCAKGINFPKAQALLEEAVRWVLAHQMYEECDSSFPAVVSAGRSELPLKGARLAWCYGDLGIATALMHAARCVPRADWEMVAIAIARKAANRTFASSQVEDAGLCHGAAGVAHMFNRIYQATGDLSFKNAAEKWLLKTLDYYEPGTGVGGFRASTIITNRPKLANLPGLVAGAAGIGLALLAACSTVEPFWDRVMLLSIPPKCGAFSDVR